MSSAHRVVFETTTNPWFGPRSRARSILAENRGDVVSPDDALSVLEGLDDAGPSLEYVRFVDYVHRTEEFRYTIAVCWTGNNPIGRQALYDKASEVVRRTGWYPLPLGGRIWSARTSRTVLARVAETRLPDFLDATLDKVIAAGPPQSGCAIRISCENGPSILLDTGFTVNLLPTDALVLLSHVHGDHCGGLLGGDVRGRTVAMSEGTFELLAAKGLSQRLLASNEIKLLAPWRSYSIGSELMVSAFPVPHLPGACGFCVQDKNVRVIYTGDISLRTSRHDFATTLLDLVSSEQKTVVLLDATMAGREAGASSSAPAELLTDQYGEVVVVAESAEHLLYAYLDLYFAVQHCASRNTVSFICSSSMRPMFQILHRPFIKREYETLDPFISAQYGRSMSAWAESRWLYWLDKSGTLPEGRRFWFIPLSEFDPGMFVSDATFLFIGRPDRAPVDQRFAAIDTTPWTLHTADSGLADATRTLLGVGARVALFHNMTKRAQKFLSAHGLAGEVIRSSSALDLRE